MSMARKIRDNVAKKSPNHSELPPAALGRVFVSC